MWWVQVRGSRKISFSDMPRGPKPAKMGPGLIELESRRFSLQVHVADGASVRVDFG